MKKRVLIFGNSHVAALKEAASAHPDLWSDLDLTFVGTHRNMLLETTISESVLTPNTDRTRQYFVDYGGKPSFDLTEYDVLAIAGCQVTAMRMMQVYRFARYMSLPSMTKVNDLATMSPMLVSQHAFAAGIASSIKPTLGATFARKLRHGTDAPILFLSQPRVAQAVMKTTKNALGALKKPVHHGDGPSLSHLFDTTITDLMNAIDVTFVPQPEDTVFKGLLTAQKYVNGAIRLTSEGRIKQPKEDLLHANKAYGKKVLDQVQQLVAT